MKWKAKWIWDAGEERPKNHWLCFRKKFDYDSSVTGARLQITADSRYFLYLNGKMMGYGPARSWPWKLSYDTYEIGSELVEGENVLAVLVTHYGTSTAQYVAGRGALIAQLDFYRAGEAITRYVATDRSWKVRRHNAFKKDTFRINAAFPWIEEFDAAAAETGWERVGYDDGEWERAVEIGPAGMEPWVNLVPREIPPLDYYSIYPQKVTALRCVKPMGQPVAVNFGPNFYPGCVDIKDKKQLGCLLTVIRSPVTAKGKIIHLSKKWPEVAERFKLNGREFILKEGEKEKAIELIKGDNLFILDISGGYQVFTVKMLFITEKPIEFSVPYRGSFYKFLTVGPFDYKPVHNIASMEGVELENRHILDSFWKINTLDELAVYDRWIKPLPDADFSSDDIYTLTVEKEVLADLPIKPSVQNLVKANDEFTELPAMSTEGDIELIVDFGRELSAFLEIELECADRTVFDFNLFESMHEGTPCYTEGLNNTFRYIARKGRQKYRSFIKRGFRYVMITVRNHNSPVRIYSVKGYGSGYPVTEVGDFFSPDHRLNEIWRITRHTLRLCSEDTYVDCPAYEQSLWTGDCRISSLVGYYLFGSYNLARRTLLLVAESLNRSELPEAQVPTGTDTILPAWSLLWMIACGEHYLFTGDMLFLEEIYPYLRKTAEGFIRHLTPSRLFKLNAWNMLDWAGMDTPADGIVTHHQALLVKALTDMAAMAKILGRKQEQEDLTETAWLIKQALNRELWDEERRAFVDCIHADGSLSRVISMQTNILVYLCSCVEGERKLIIEDYLRKPPDDFIPIGTPFISFLFYEALRQQGGSDAVRRIVDDIRERWGKMVDYGATTCWETFPGFYKNVLTRSHCHAWSTAPGYYLPACILGVRPLAPGFKRVAVMPDLAGLEWAKGTVPTPLGPVTVDLRATEDELIVNIKIPPEMDCEVVVDESLHPRITVNGKHMRENELKGR
ncbi:MAG: alpha-L-rhamnosidase [Halanaerobiales bacterium]|nr:alpha-L-rhamnosidase [Halanaerobiales bacterium]